MKTRILAAALATAFALPSFGADAPKDPAPPKEPKAFDFDFRFNFDLGDFDLLADAGDGAQRGAEIAREQAEHMRDWAQQFSESMQGSMAYIFSDRVGRGKVVKGAPYSADIVTETNQRLADGNLITHKKVSRVYRDGEGRTRQESYRDDKLRSVYITDPVERVNYTLIPEAKMAVTIPRVETRIERSGSRAEREKVIEHETTHGDRRVTVRTVEDKDGGPGVREEVRVQVIRMGDGTSKEVIIPIPPVPPVPPVAATPPIPPIPPLPPIPAGKIATRNAINVTPESWYWPELQVTVSSRHDDPRPGESIYRLAAIKRAEPQPDLFKVPEGYQTRGRRKPEEKPEAKR